MIRCASKNDHLNWDLYVPQLAGAIRSTVNRSTGYTPNRLMLLHEVAKPVDILFGVAQKNSSQETPEDYVAQLETILKKTHDSARAHLKSNVKIAKRDYDLRSFSKHYNCGDLVYLLDPQIKMGVSKKLQTIYKCPYLITRVISPVLYKIKDKRRETVVHHDRLRECTDRFIPLWMRRMRNDFLSTEDTILQLEDDQDYSNPVDPLENLESLFKGDTVDQPPISFPRSTSSNVTVGSDPMDSGDASVDFPVISPTITRTGRQVKPSAWLKDYEL